jgi:hypothetical protein
VTENVRIVTRAAEGGAFDEAYDAWRKTKNVTEEEYASIEAWVRQLDDLVELSLAEVVEAFEDSLKAAYKRHYERQVEMDPNHPFTLRRRAQVERAHRAIYGGEA